MLSNYCTNLSSNIAISVPLPAQKLYRMSWRQTLALRQVSIIASTIFHRNFNRPIP